MTSDDVRVIIYKRPLRALAWTLVEPGKPFLAMALTGALPKKSKVEAYGYGTTEDEAIAALEAAVLAPPPPPQPKTKRLDTRKFHLARAEAPEQAFHSVCTVPDCGKVVIRQFGKDARRTVWRHAKPGERI